jgi:hypothetical protein
MTAILTEDEALNLLDEVMPLVDDRWQFDAGLMQEFMSDGPKSVQEVLDFIESLVENLSDEEREMLRPGWQKVLGGAHFSE